MKVITKEKDKCKKIFIDWFKDISNIKENVKNIKIYSDSKEIFDCEKYFNKKTIHQWIVNNYLKNKINK